MMIRRVLVDHARHNRRKKRGGGAEMLPLNDALDFSPQKSVDILRLDDALVALREMDERQSQIVEMKFFGGLELKEIAEALGVSATTVKREWVSARAWLLRELQ